MRVWVMRRHFVCDSAARQNAHPSRRSFEQTLKVCCDRTVNDKAACQSLV
jgi:hypothetical protein